MGSILRGAGAAGVTCNIRVPGLKPRADVEFPGKDLTRSRPLINVVSLSSSSEISSLKLQLGPGNGISQGHCRSRHVACRTCPVSRGRRAWAQAFALASGPVRGQHAQPWALVQISWARFSLYHPSVSWLSCSCAPGPSQLQTLAGATPPLGVPSPLSFHYCTVTPGRLS